MFASTATAARPTMQGTRLASRFGNYSPVLYSRTALTDEQINQVAPSVFALEPHESRSETYTYIPTAQVLTGLRKEGFEPFMVAQTRVRNEGKRDYTKHMMRLRHVSQKADREVPEIILLNSHDGTSSYQMIAGMFRFVCTNGLVCGDVLEDVKVRHKGNVVDGVIQGAFDVLDGFDLVREVRDDLQAITLNDREARVFADAALQLRYDVTDIKPAPITADAVLAPRRRDDTGMDLWTVFNRTQENMIRGGQVGRNAAGRRARTREVTGIDQSVKLNRALWTLAEGMKNIKGA